MGKMPFGLKIAIINRAFRREMDEKAAELGLTYVQLRALGSVSRLEAAGYEEIHQKDLERIEHVSHPAMTKLLQRLESKGFVRCTPSRSDRRYKCVSCTPSSAGIHTRILEQDAQVLDQLCCGLEPEERRALLAGIDRLVEQIDWEDGSAIKK